jgi:hypothetical protein
LPFSGGKGVLHDVGLRLNRFKHSLG